MTNQSECFEEYHFQPYNATHTLISTSSNSFTQFDSSPGYSDALYESHNEHYCEVSTEFIINGNSYPEYSAR